MASGGARATSGPAPDPNALRRDRPSDAGWTTLPAKGRSAPAPEWPLLAADAHIDALTKEAGDSEALLMVVERSAEKWHARELEHWAREWRRPQAIMWERNGQDVEVALYVRALASAERADAGVTLRTLVKQMQEALGVSLPGLARNRWKIGHVEEAAPRAAAKGPSARDRFKVVNGGGEG